MNRIFLIGETVYDIVFKDAETIASVPGGSLLNACVSLGRLGQEAYYVSELGNDPLGRYVKDFLKKNNISTDYLVEYPDNNTSIAIADLDKENNATYRFYKDYPENRLNVQLPVLGEGDMLMFGSSFAINEAVRPALLSFVRAARENGALVYYDPNFRGASKERMPLVRKMIEENMSLSHVVKGSDEDFEGIFNFSEGRSVSDACKALGVQLVVRTLGEKGAEAWSGSTYAFAGGRDVAVKSTIGAGDTFNAGVVWQLNQSNVRPEDLSDLKVCKLQQILDIASLMASAVCGIYDNYISAEFAQKIKDRYVVL